MINREKVSKTCFDRFFAALPFQVSTAQLIPSSFSQLLISTTPFSTNPKQRSLSSTTVTAALVKGLHRLGRRLQKVFSLGNELCDVRRLIAQVTRTMKFAGRMKS
jgi:hypothetical protein